MNRLPELPADFQLYFDSSTECHHCSKTIGEDCAVICVSCGVESEIIRLKMNNLTPYVWNYAKVRTLISCDNCVVRNCPTDHQSTTSLLRCVLESHFDGQLATMLGQINAAKLPLKDRDVINTILRLKEKCLLSKSTEEGRIFVETALVLIQAVHQHQRSPNHEISKNISKMLVGVFECGVCFHEFDSRLKRPVIGHCGHTICEQCSQGVRQYNFGHCPLCQSRNSMLTASKDQLLNSIRGQAPCSECVEPLQTKPHCEMCHHNGSPLNCNHTRIELPKLSTAKLLHQINIFKDHDLIINRQYEINYENMKKQCEELQLEQGLAIRAHSLMLNEEETMMREKQMQLKRIQISTPTEDELEIIRIKLRKMKEQNDSFAQQHELQTANKVVCSSCKFMTRLETLQICLHCRRNASIFRKNPKNDSLEIIDQEKLISMFNSALAPFLDNLSGSEQDRATKTAIDFLKKKCSEAKSLEDGQTFVEQAKLVASLKEAPKEPKPSPMPRSSGSSRRKQPSQNIRQSQTSVNTLDDSIIII